MGHVFVSHSEKDVAKVKEIVDGLECAGYPAWTFERDTLPGTSYLVQIQEAIEKCDAVILVATANSLASDQVAKEVVAAFERQKPFFPILLGITPSELKEGQPEWRHALGGTAFITVGTEGIRPCIDRVVNGLSAKGIGLGAARQTQNVTVPILSLPDPNLYAERTLAARRDIEGERKHVTVLFVSVTNLTIAKNEMDPETAHRLIVDCLALISEETRKFGGTVVQFLSNGVMAIFGAPTVLEDAPKRAVHAALGIRHRLNECADRLRSDWIEFSMRFGMDSGLALVGHEGEDPTTGYTVTGEPVDTAFRMMSLAQPDMILVSENTYCLTEGFFEFQSFGNEDESGRNQPIVAHFLLGASKAKTRLGVSVARGLTPFIGRRNELEQLIERFELSGGGQGQIVGIVGAPGVGKSRLLLQMRESLPHGRFVYLEGGCYHYGDSVPYLPLLQILRLYFGIEEGETESSAKRKMHERIQKLDPRLESFLPPLQEILSLKVSDEQYQKLDPPRKRERIIDAIRNLLLRQSQDLPLVLAVEDLHWIDRPSEEFLGHLVASISHNKILLVLLFRPQYRPPWFNKTNYRQIRVSEFSPETSVEMVHAMLGGVKATPELNELITTRSVGNPLFMEELIRSLLDGGAIQRNNGFYTLSFKASDIQIPATVQGIIDARIARLNTGPRKTLQVASVIGRGFSFPVLQNVMSGTEDLRSHLADLQAGEFIYEETPYPEPEYLFKHALTREVAYSSLLMKNRREIHHRIGRVIEDLYPNKLEEFYETLAYHYSRSDDLQKAVNYLKLSSLKAGSQNSLVEAIRFGKEAIDLLSHASQTDENKRKGIEMRLLLTGPLTATGWADEGLLLMEEGVELAEAVGDSTNLANFWGSMGVANAVRRNATRGIEYAEKAYKAARETGDLSLIATSCFELCLAYSVGDAHHRIVEIVPPVLKMLESAHMESRVDLGKYYNYNLYSVLQSYYGSSRAEMGDFEEGLRQCQQAIDLARGLGNVYSLGLVEFLGGMAFLAKGEVVKAIEQLERSAQFCEKGQLSVLLWMAPTVQGYAHLMSGEVEVARRFFEERIENYRRTQYATLISMNYYGLGLTCLQSGDIASAREYFKESLRLAVKHGEKAFEGMSMITLGGLTANEGPSQQAIAEEQTLTGMKILEDLRLRPLQAEACTILGRLFVEKGKTEKAFELLQKAKSLFQEMDMDNGLARVETALREIRSV